MSRSSRRLLAARKILPQLAFSPIIASSSKQDVNVTLKRMNVAGGRDFCPENGRADVSDARVKVA